MRNIPVGTGEAHLGRGETAFEGVAGGEIEGYRGGGAGGEHHGIIRGLALFHGNLAGGGEPHTGHIIVQVDTSDIGGIQTIVMQVSTDRRGRDNGIVDIAIHHKIIHTRDGNDLVGGITISGKG